MFLVSVIIPVYNAEYSLKTAIDSVINQSLGFENIELILVDDNSSDKSREIIKEYSQQFDNIIYYFSKLNHGFPGFGRNMGLKLSSANYVMFLDNDDVYDKDMCKTLYETITNENVDLVSCGRLLIDSLGEIKDDYHCSCGKIQDNFLIFENDETLSFCSKTVWNKIFKKEIVDKFNLKFLENTAADDYLFSVEYHSKSKKIIHLTDYYGYHWNIIDESLSHNLQIEQMDDVLNAYNYLACKLKEENLLSNADVIVNDMVEMLIIKSSFIQCNLNELNEVLKKICCFEKEINFNLSLNNKWLNIINILILKNQFNLAILCLKLVTGIRNITILRKINRLFK